MDIKTDQHMIKMKPDINYMIFYYIALITVLIFYYFAIEDYINQNDEFGIIFVSIILGILLYMMFNLKRLTINQHTNQVEISSMIGLKKKTIFYHDVDRFYIEISFIPARLHYSASVSYTIFLGLKSSKRISLFHITDLKQAMHNLNVVTKLIGCKQLLMAKNIY